MKRKLDRFPIPESYSLKKGALILATSILLSLSAVKAQVQKTLGKDQKLNTTEWIGQGLGDNEIAVFDSPPDYDGLTPENQQAILCPRVIFTAILVTEKVAAQLEEEYGGWVERGYQLSTKGMKWAEAVVNNSGADIDCVMLPPRDTIHIPESIVPDPDNGGTLEQVALQLNEQFGDPDSYLSQRFDALAEKYNIPREKLYYIAYAKNEYDWGPGAYTNGGGRGFIMRGNRAFRYRSIAWENYLDKVEGDPDIYPHEVVKDWFGVDGESGTTPLRGSVYEIPNGVDLRPDANYPAFLEQANTPSIKTSLAHIQNSGISQANPMRYELRTDLNMGTPFAVPMGVDGADAFHHIDWEGSLDQFFTPRAGSTNDTLISSGEFSETINVLENDTSNQKRLEFFGIPELPEGASVEISRGTGNNGQDELLVELSGGVPDFELPLVSYDESGDTISSPTFFVHRFLVGEKERPEALHFPSILFPNPWNGETPVSIDIDNPQKEDVVIDIFDITGRKLCSLPQGKLESGRIDFSGYFSDFVQKKGMYIIRVQKGNTSESIPFVRQ